MCCIYIYTCITQAPVTRAHTMSKAQLIRLLIQHGPILHNFTKSRFVEIWKIICGYEDSLSMGVMRRITLGEIMNKEDENCDLIEFQDILKNTVRLFLDKPTIFNNDPNVPSQLMWSDAIFIKQIEKIQTLSNEKLLKLSLLAAVYNSLDLTFFCLSIYDKNNSTSLAKDLMSK